MEYKEEVNPVTKVKTPIPIITTSITSCLGVNPWFQKQRAWIMGGRIIPTETPQTEPTNAMKLSSWGIQIPRTPE